MATIANALLFDMLFAKIKNAIHVGEAITMVVIRAIDLVVSRIVKQTFAKRAKGTEIVTISKLTM